MPPKKLPKIAAQPKSSDALITRGARDVAPSSSRNRPQGEKPTTTRAMVLRNGKYGARGTGELVLMSRLTGHEKVVLLAEDLMERSRVAIMAPFNIGQCLKIAESHYEAFIDDIANLKDPDLFQHEILAEVKARVPNEQTEIAVLQDPTAVASILATRIHNTYMLASAWKIIFDCLAKFARKGVNDQNIKTKLKTDPQFRSRYLALYDMVNVMVDIGQSKVSVLATTTPHYVRYFKRTEDAQHGEADFSFQIAELKEACKSFIDSIILELCFPDAPFTKPVLFQILHDAIKESPREAKRFPQALWDAIGDWSDSIELQQLLEAPLLAPDVKHLKDDQRAVWDEYERWADAQLLSEKASYIVDNFKDLVNPSKETTPPMLTKIWKAINYNYRVIAGNDLDSLWHLAGVTDGNSVWHGFYDSTLAPQKEDWKPRRPRRQADSGSQAIILRKGKGGSSDESDSMPDLLTASDSSVTDSDSQNSESGEDDSHPYGGDSDGNWSDSDYDSDQEEEMRALAKEAFDFAYSSGWYEDVKKPSENEAEKRTKEDMEGNPFLKLLGSLRGRIFSAGPKLKTTSRTAPRGKGGQGTAAIGVPANTVTVEEVEDEDDDRQHIKKKKKKKPKKKKPTKASDSTATSDALANPLAESPPASPPPLHGEPKHTTPPSPEPSQKSSATKVPPQFERLKEKSRPSLGASASFASTTSLTSTIESTVPTAQSARSYLQSENLVNQKSKVKSRPDPASLAPVPEKKNFLSRIGIGKDKAEKERAEEMSKSARQSWFSRLSKKTSGYMRQLLGISDDSGLKSMKWEHFLKLMREMGFSYDPSTAGSSVRFDPPDPRDKPITFHKPHPDPTLHPILVKVYHKRLKKQYGWTAEEFLKGASGSA
ncbi:hypothetical protein AX16_005235 [Volvariella volvacea WC 439]|nr:hypothetical protein AX16_005235 [Volvariella volvacea WC 439]